MAKKLYSFVCRACNEHTERHAKKTPVFCEECYGFRQAWITMRSPSQWRDRSCKNCGVYLHNCIYGARQICRDCEGWHERRRWKTVRRVRQEVRPGIWSCSCCEREMPADEFGVERSTGRIQSQCRFCRNELKKASDRSIEFANRKKRRQSAAVSSELKRKRDARIKAIVAKWDRAHNAKVRERERQSLVAQKPWLADGLTAAERSKLWYHATQKSNPVEVVWSRQRHRLKKALNQYKLTMKALGCSLEELAPLPRDEYAEALAVMAKAAGFDEVTNAAFYFKRGLKEFGGPTIDGVKRLLSLANLEVRQSYFDETYKSDKPWLGKGLSTYQRSKLREAVDPDFRARMRLHSRVASRNRGKARDVAKNVHRSLKRGTPNRPTFKFLGYSAEDLRIHLEKQFTKSMSWDAFLEGRIHIDHRRPLASFNLADEAQLREAWALTNLQPLWAKDNITKGASQTLLL